MKFFFSFLFETKDSYSKVNERQSQGPRQQLGEVREPEPRRKKQRKQHDDPARSTTNQGKSPRGKPPRLLTKSQN
jgi:hypothetical protein